ncbi:MAG: TonB-dependent receptor [Gammaproteobacteria bacterium]|nr:TonB-dependent receptor [Gammaproteobacteria bacterium]
MKIYPFLSLLWGVNLSLFAATQTDQRLDHFLSLSFEELINLETSIATAARQSLTRAPAVVTVLTSDDIKATGAVNLIDVLSSVPGIYIRTDPFANRPLIHFRGAKATNTLLMVNGNPMKDLMWVFGIYWKGLPASMIDRVEIIRGPGSALFGADASAGVINVITKTAGKIEGTEVGLRLGNFNTQAASLQHGTSLNGYDIGLTAELSTTDSHNPYIASDRQTIQDQSFSTSASLAPANAQYGWRGEDIRLSVAREGWRLHADYMRHADLETGMTGISVLDPVTVAEDSRYNIDLLYDSKDRYEDWILSAELGYQNVDYSSGDGFQEWPAGYTNTTGTWPQGVLNQMESSERSLAFETSGLYNGLTGHALRIGVGYTVQDLYSVKHMVNSGLRPDGTLLPAGGPLVDVSDSPYAFAPEKKRRITHLFVQDVWSISSDWELTAGARYDDYSDFGDTLNPRLALVWQSTARLTSKLLYGEAFRAPSYQELFSETSRALPNDQLDPEKSSTLELSFTYATAKSLQLSMNLFHFKQSEIIQRTDVAGLSKKQFNNTGTHRTNGVEFEMMWQALEDLRVHANFSLQDQENNEFRLYQIPDESIYLRADWAFLPEWNWNIQSNWTGERPRPSADTRSTLKDYAITDTTVRYGNQKEWDFTVSIRNLFDVDAREYSKGSLPDDFPLPGRNLYIEMHYKF